MRGFFSLSFVALLLLLNVSSVSSQAKTDPLKLSISLTATTLNLHREIKVKVKVENKTDHTVDLKNHRDVIFKLTKHDKEIGNCHRSECLASTFPLKTNKIIKSGESFDFEADLTSLHWYDEISSAYDFREPENMAEVIQSGSYHLFMSLYLPAENSAKGNSRLVEIKSNKILVKFE